MRKKRNIAILIILFLFIASTVTYAADVGAITNKKNWSSPADETAAKIRSNVIAIVQVVGVSVAVVMIIAVAIKYMTSAPNDRAEVKKHAIPYIVGAILIFASAGIVELLRQFANQTIN